MGLTGKYIIAAGDISSSPVLLKRFRGKAAKEIYRCGKAFVVTGSFSKPVIQGLATIPAELGKGYLYSAVGHVGETIIGYVSGIGVVRFVYKVAEPAKIKAVARLCYNIAGLPVTIYSKGIGAAFDMLQISKIEKAWFGEPVYIFDDNRFWLEKNFTLTDVFNFVDENIES